MAEALQPPIDVRLMNMAATALFLCCGALVLAAGVWWALRYPGFAIGRIVVEGDLAHTNAITLRANVAPKLDSNFFTVDLARTRDAFQAVPWVRRALVRREFPRTLRVALQEHEAVAYWGDDDDSTLLNRQGEVFEANVDEVGDAALPRLRGPEGQSAEVLQMFHTLAPAFAPLGLDVEDLSLSPRGSWRARLDGGAAIELGSGAPAEVLARVRRFAGTLTQVAARYGRRPDALESADLRHQDGYALRLQGVTTVVETHPKPATQQGPR
ncbi:cell division protein FtsQ/DivIB [Ramlibacter sp. H39-3-26]|uniref:cell division protein FtsQ/DivIB n=1 Tax=Curvibacter soli TaxID=3031331 RepID=UPI0023DA3DE1|nr:cell division protein FtsQ/DivIB [Ramlibacter sp. H39-3-26]MDF1484674.1 cell division protein FtsQ/DivIB [Ramlibacter sp. H39-3-26]